MKPLLFALTSFALGAFIAAIVFGQETAKQFEVASVKPSQPAEPNTRRSSLQFGAGESLTATYMTLRSLISVAFNIRDFQISGGPSWIGAERYDIEAKMAATVTSHTRDLTDQQRKEADDQTRERLRSLLSDRFGLVVHRETREHTVYLLTIGKNGPKLKEVTTPADRHGTSGGRGRNQGYAAKLEWLAGILSNVIGLPVLDKTGLTGYYDWVLEWTPDMTLQPSTSQPDAAASVDGSPPSIFIALQEQLGLRLETGKGPVEMVVIDHVNRPSPN